MDEQPTEQKKNSTMSTALVIIALIAVLSLGVVGYQMMNKQQAPTQQVTTSTPTGTEQQSTEQPTTAAATQGTYKNGTYSAIGDYTSPGGEETLDVTLTLKDNVVTDAIVKPQATRPNSVKFQGMFAANYKPMVVGKKIEEVVLTKVSGSSLAPKGFNDAVEKIKAEARS